MTHNKVGIPRLSAFSLHTVTRMLELREKVFEGPGPITTTGNPAPTPGSRRSLYRAKHVHTTSTRQS